MRTEKKPRTRSRSLARTAGKAALSRLPLVERLGKAAKGYQDERVRSWLKFLVANSDDAAAFTETVERALLREQNEIAVAFMDAARAAADAVDVNVLPAIGLLTRRFVATQTPSRIIYRAVLDLLRSMDGDVWIALCGVLPILSAAAAHTPVVRTNLLFDPGYDAWNWYITGQETVPLLRGEIAYRVAMSLVADRSLHFEEKVPSRMLVFIRELIDVLGSINPR